MKRLLIAFMLACVLSATALAGDMPGGGKSATGDMPIVGKSVTGDMPGVGSPIAPPQSVPGEMPGEGSATSSETESSLVTTVLFAFLTLIGR